MSDDTQRLLHLSLLGEAVDCLDDVCVFVWNEEHRYVAVNEAACRVVGVPREELVGMPVGSLTPGAAEQFARLHAGGAVDGSHSFVRPDGETVDLRWTTAPTRIAGLPYMVSVCRRVV